MTERLNGVIRALETGRRIAFTSFIQAEIENAVNFAQSVNDGVVFELEHNPWDIGALRTAMQFLLLRERIAKAGSVACQMTPIVRIPPSGNEMNLWFAKQALDLGAYGIVWPRISTPEEAYNAVSACRYPRLKSAPLLNLPACVAMHQCRLRAIGVYRSRNTTNVPTCGRLRRRAKSCRS